MQFGKLKSLSSCKEVIADWTHMENRSKGEGDSGMCAVRYSIEDHSDRPTETGQGKT